MRYCYLFLSIVMTFTAWSCKKDQHAVAEDCEKLITALAEDDKEALRSEIDGMIDQLNLQSATTFSQQQQDMERFINRLNQCNNIEADLFCLWCIDT